jgi:hypothetical protein
MKGENIMADEYVKGSGTGRGGWRGGGRKKGVKIGRIKPETVSFHRNVTPDEKEFLEKCLAEYRANKDNDELS